MKNDSLLVLFGRKHLFCYWHGACANEVLIMPQSEAGKGSNRRPTDEKKVSENWPYKDKPCSECGDIKCPKVKYKSMACPGSKGL